MAFDPAPSAWISPAYVISPDNEVALGTSDDVDGTQIAVSAADVDPTTGDVRVLFYALCEMMADAWDAQAEEDRPTKMTIQRTSYANADGSEITHSYSISVIN